MAEMVNRLIEVSKLQSSGMRPSRRLIKAHKLVSKKIKSLQPFAREKGIAMANELPVDMFIAVDPDLFGEVIYNIISNALKFCERGDKITLFFSEEADKSVIAVKDTGPGIDGIFLENLFRHEIKTSSTGTAGEQGTGLGLPLCMDIIKAHGGDIKVESVEGDGSTFFLEFPPMGDFIIIADDQDVWRSTMQEHLSNNFDTIIIEAENGLEVLDILYDAKPALIITDIDMPGINGLQLIEQLKENPESRDIPVIACSALRFLDTLEGGKTDIKTKAISLGAELFLPKPLLKESLLSAVSKYLK
jgi:CheY-like chemotaxis protein